jgi:hypothetical protein
MVVVLALVVGATLLHGCQSARDVDALPVKDLPSLADVPLQDLLDKHGSPRSSETYSIATLATKNWYHGIVFDKYPKTDANRDVEIRLVTWPDPAREGYQIHVCCHLINGKWAVLGAVRIQEGVKF